METETQAATLAMDGRTLSIGDHVSTPMGEGYIISLAPLDDLDVFVKLHTPRDLGSKFWFRFSEVKAA